MSNDHVSRERWLHDLRHALGVAQEHQRIAADLRKLRRTGDLPGAWALLLSVCKWQWFMHFTFKPTLTTKHGGVHPERADKAFRYFISCLNRELYGPNWARNRFGGVVWARGQEWHKDGRIHFHAVAAAVNGDLNKLGRRLTWMDFWGREFGICRITPPESQQNCLDYITKYVAKGGEVDFSRNFAEIFGMKTRGSEAGALQRPAKRADASIAAEAGKQQVEGREIRFPLLDPAEASAAGRGDEPQGWGDSPEARMIKIEEWLSNEPEQ